MNTGMVVARERPAWDFVGSLHGKEWKRAYLKPFIVQVWRKLSHHETSTDASCGVLHHASPRSASSGIKLAVTLEVSKPFAMF